MWEENEPTYKARCSIKFVNHGKYEEVTLDISVEAEKLTDLQEKEVIIEAYKQFIDEYILDKFTLITDVVSVEVVEVTSELEEALNQALSESEYDEVV
tara:strand:+ start:458 stop:751 length:294 start_codon:yes stop_codon:yes gene_type:complete